MKYSTKKKAFTIVELVIVIAIIAVLAAILVPTFTSVVKKAKESNDTQLVRNLNTALTTDAAINGKHKTMYSALQAAEDFGYNVEKINASATDNEILWDSVNDCFVYQKGSDLSGIEYIPNSKTEDVTDAYKFWKIAKSAEDLTGGYSYYIGYNANGATINVSTGVDVGTNTGIAAINYTNPEAGQDVVIRTKGDQCVVTIKAPADNIQFYGFAKAITVTEVAPSSLHIYGSVNELKVLKGHVEVENTGVVFTIAEIDEGASVTNHGYIAAKSNSVTAGIEGKAVGGDYEIDSLAKLEIFRDTVNAGNSFEGLTVKLTADIKLNDGWVPIGEGSRKTASNTQIGKPEWKISGTAFQGTFNGNHHTISNLNNKGFVPTVARLGEDDAPKKIYSYGLFALTASGAEIKDLTLRSVDIDTTTYADANVVGDSVAALVGFSAGSLTVSNVQVYDGSIKATDAVGGIVGRAYKQDGSSTINVTISDCVNHASVTGIRKAAGILGYTATTNGITVQSCINNGTITTESEGEAVAGIITVGSNQDFQVKNNTNNGNIYGQSAELTRSIGSGTAKDRFNQGSIADNTTGDAVKVYVNGSEATSENLDFN